MDTALQSSVYVSSPEFAGWLMKRGFHWRKLWKKRWVALHGAEIVYMDKEPTIENSNNLTITKAQITTATVIDRDDIDGNSNGFAIHVNDGHTPTWYLRAESAREKKSWLMRLQHVHAIVKWLEDFEKVKVLGVGGTGIVYELLHKSNGQRYAMKEMEIKNKQQMQMAISEAEMLKDIMENISHPNIMHIEKVFQVGSKFYLVFPLCTGGELYEHIIRRGHFTEHDAAIITRDLIGGLHALHEHDILHLDIKPENLLFDSMGDNAKIKITDFGLSKLFSDQQNTARGKFSMKLMEDRLRTLQETGELNREKLRGTIGYMAPELILTGHCSKATDIFAAGVVLFILLCGRPPFNSKSNREVLEKTARGQYNMTGAEWDDISPEAKDLVAKMLIVNPEERISTTDILNHPWIKQLDEDQQSVDDVSSTSSGNEVHTPGSISHSRSGSYRSNTLNRKGSGVNLANALRHLSGHVKQLQSEKFATNVTRLVSLMQQSGQSKSTLSKLYLVPALTSGAKGGSDVKGSSNSVVGNNNNNEITKTDEEMELLFLNSEFREGFAEAIRNLSDNDSGRLSIEQFMAIVKYVTLNSSNNNTTAAATAAAIANGGGNGGGSGSSSEKITGNTGGGIGGGSEKANNNVGLGPLIISKFIDRDGDGFITADDIFAAQALILQRSEIFLKVVFRIYAEAIWYPGRQLNLRSLMQQTPLKGDQSGLSTPGGSKVLASSDSLLPTVVEPPKFITARHVGAVFEKLGFEASAGQRAFTILCEALSRIKTENKDRIDENEEESPTNSLYKGLPSPTPPNAALAKAFEDMDDGDTPRKSNRFGVPDEITSAQKRDSMRESSTVDKSGNNGVSPPPAGGSSSNNRMDLSDFIRAVELDDVLIQVVFRKTRYKMVSLFQAAENRVRTYSEEDNDQLSEEDNAYNSGRERDSNGNNNSNYAMRKSKSRMSSKDITADLIEQELKIVFDNLRASEANNRPTFPLANAVGRATFSAAMGLAAKVAIGTQALMEATYENFESVDSSPASTPQSVRLPSTSNNPPKLRGVAALAGVDSDDEA